MPKCFYCFQETNNFDYLTKCKCNFYGHYDCWNKYLNNYFICPICKKNTIILKINIPKIDNEGNVIKNNKNYFLLILIVHIIIVFIFLKYSFSL